AGIILAIDMPRAAPCHIRTVRDVEKSHRQQMCPYHRSKCDIKVSCSGAPKAGRRRRSASPHPATVDEIPSKCQLLRRHNYFEIVDTHKLRRPVAAGQRLSTATQGIVTTHVPKY